MGKGNREPGFEQREVRVMRTAETALQIIRDTAIHAGRPVQKRNTKQVTGEPCAWKHARTVQREAVGNVPKGNALAAYST